VVVGMISVIVWSSFGHIIYIYIEVLRKGEYVGTLGFDGSSHFYWR
jgi:hypothetical protein